MKSPMAATAEALEPSETGYSELRVLHSMAGYYVGTVYIDPETGVEEPGTRDSEYFPRKQEAEAFLREITASGDSSGLRNHP